MKIEEVKFKFSRAILISNLNKLGAFSVLFTSVVDTFRGKKLWSRQLFMVITEAFMWNIISQNRCADNL